MRSASLPTPALVMILPSTPVSAISSGDLVEISMGGIAELSDLFEFIAVGADAFQIGTANFIHPSICSKLAIELEEFMDKNNFKDFEELKGAIRND